MRCSTSEIPATGDVIAKIPNSTREDIDPRHEEARGPPSKARRGAAWTSAPGRGWSIRLADAFEANLDTLYRLETLNNGRPVNETRAAMCRDCRTFSGISQASRWRAVTVIPVEGAYLNYTLRTPIGIVANCTPFNHPLMSPVQIAGGGAGERMRHGCQAVRNIPR